VKYEWDDDILPQQKDRHKVEFAFLRSLRMMLPLYSTLAICFLACHKPSCQATFTGGQGRGMSLNWLHLLKLTHSLGALCKIALLTQGSCSGQCELLEHGNWKLQLDP